MLVQAAAQKWGVEQARCRAENSTVINTATNARLSYGSLAEAAVETACARRRGAQGSRRSSRSSASPRKRLDTPVKVDGSATFGIDVRLPGMLYAVVARCPVFGGKVASFDATKAKAVPGVKSVVQISNGVAVVADNTWSAMQGRNALSSQMGRRPDRCVSARAGITQSFAEHHADNPAQCARKEGDARGALAAAAKKIEAVYEVPYLAHAPMEPLNCVADVRADALRSLGVHAGADRRAQRGGADHRAQARSRAGPHQIHGRRIRPPRPRRLHRRGGGGLQSRRAFR